RFRMSDDDPHIVQGVATADKCPHGLLLAAGVHFVVDVGLCVIVGVGLHVTVGVRLHIIIGVRRHVIIGMGLHDAVLLERRHLYCAEHLLSHGTGGNQQRRFSE